jgi:hypothetical protein
MRCLWVVGLSVAMFSVACGGDDDRPSGSSNGGDGAGTATGGTNNTNPAGGAGQGAGPTSYPEPPYGTNVGEVFAFVDFEGYMNPAAMGLASMQSFYPASMADNQSSGPTHVLMHLAAMW